jgi:predicted metal-dependent phosphoesterase TrpH
MCRSNFLLAVAASALLIFSSTSALSHPSQCGAKPQELTLTGHIDPAEVFSFVYVPFGVPPGVTNITVLQNYSSKGAGNSLDLGVFDPLGTGSISSLTGYTGSRGWSGGFRSNFTISADGATPGYNAGPILPGTWNVVLGPYTSLPSGIDWQLNITLSYDTSAFSTPWSPTHAAINLIPSSQLQQPLSFPPQWLRGDLHMHSVYSDGRYLPSQQIANALSQNLSFIFFSEHNTASGNQNIGSWIPPDADLLVLCAIEVTTRHGHWNAFGLEPAQQVEWRYTNASGDVGYETAARQVHAAGGLVSVNHPFQNCSRCDWTLPWEWNDAIEVWNGRFDPFDEQAVQWWHQELVRGKKVVAVGGSDAHHPGDMNGIPTTVVRATERSQAGVVRGIREGAVYIVEGPGKDLEFYLEPQTHSDEGEGQQPPNLRWEIGQTVTEKDRMVSEVPAPLTATFAGSGFDGATVEACFISEAGYFHNESIVPGKEIVQVLEEGLRFVRVEVRNASDILLALTNPIFLA